MIENILVGIGQLLVVGLPSWIILLFTVDAPLVPGADVFLITLAQVLFLVVFIAWVRWRGRTQATSGVEPPETERAGTD